jgi:AcrR family transcriptional regulator
MAADGEMRERILNGATEALAIYGTRRFSISGASERSGVSRGTFYRYFPTKESLFDALTAHLGGGFRRCLHDRLSGADGNPELEDRAHLVAQAVREYVDQTPVLSQLLLAEPAFVQKLYTENICNLMRLVATAIEPRFDSLTTSDQTELLASAEIMVRVAISFRLVAPDGSGLPEGTLTDKLAELARHAQVNVTPPLAKTAVGR